jgi:hypothetical protein
MKSNEDAKIETAYNYAFNYYKQHGRSLDHQNACINQMIGLTGFDRGTCIEIQSPVQSIMMYNETVELGNTIVQQQLNIVTGIIRDHLLNINHGNVEKNQSSDSSFKTPQAPYVSKTLAYTAQEMVSWLEHTNNTQNLKFNLPYKEINLSGKNVTNEDMVFFAQRMSNFAFHLDSLQLNHNPIGDSGIQALFNCAFTVPLGRSVVHLKLNNCNFGDVGAELIAAYARDGYLPATRAIDLHGNKLSIENPLFAQLAKNIQQPIKITVDTIYDGAKKQGTFALGTKEAKQGIVKEWLKIAQNNGVDTQNVVVSKDIFEAVGNTLKLGFNFNLGWAKCSVIPKDVKSFAADKILAKASPQAATVKTGVDIAFCYFESCDEAMSSQHGVQFLGDLGLLPQGEFIDAIE